MIKYQSERIYSFGSKFNTHTLSWWEILVSRFEISIVLNLRVTFSICLAARRTMGYGVNIFGLIPQTGEGFLPLYSIQTGSSTHPAPCPMGMAGGTSPDLKWRKADRSPPPSAKVKNGGDIQPLPTYIFIVWFLIN